MKKAFLAGGCFWGLEELFRESKGVINTEVGYSGGKLLNPTYENHEGHAEALEITYDEEAVSYKEVIDFFFRIHNPTTLNQQGNDIGESYRSAIFYQTEEEKENALELIKLVEDSKKWGDLKVVTTLERFRIFYKAETHHQDYLQKNPGGYTCHAIRFDSFLG